MKVDAGEFGNFSEKVQIRFQKSTRVVVSLVDLRIKNKGNGNAAATELVYVDPPKRWYQKTWFLITAGIGVAVLGGYIGYKLTDVPVIDCDTMEAKCQP